MNAHKNAQLMPHSRPVLVRCVLEDEQMPQNGAHASGETSARTGCGPARIQETAATSHPLCRHLHVPGPVAVSRPLSEPGGRGTRIRTGFLP